LIAFVLIESLLLFLVLDVLEKNLEVILVFWDPSRDVFGVFGVFGDLPFGDMPLGVLGDSDLDFSSFGDLDRALRNDFGEGDLDRAPTSLCDLDRALASFGDWDRLFDSLGDLDRLFDSLGDLDRAL